MILYFFMEVECIGNTQIIHMEETGITQRTIGLMRNYKKNNAWNIRCLVDESFVTANQQTSVLYCRLSDFRTLSRGQCGSLSHASVTGLASG